MQNIATFAALALCACALALGASACSKQDPARLAPSASPLSSAAPASETSRTFAIDPKRSGISFTMDAELEKISGRAPESARGELFIDLQDLSRTSGLVKIDLDRLSIYKRVRDDVSDDFGAEDESDKQNRDMRNWLQIGGDAPKGEREEFRWAQFKITKVQASPNNVRALGGAERKARATVTGEFRLHGRVSEKTIEADLVFAFKGDAPASLTIRTRQPFAVGLAEHDVRPRRSFTELADATLEALGRKVAKVAQVSLNARATAK